MYRINSSRIPQKALSQKLEINFSPFICIPFLLFSYIVIYGTTLASPAENDWRSQIYGKEMFMASKYTVCILGYTELTQNYQNAFLSEDFDIILPLKTASPFDLLNDLFCVYSIVQVSDLLILPGGGDIDPAFFHQQNTTSRNIDFILDRIQFEFLDAFVKFKKPVIGICKGMQLINIFFGGTLLQDMPFPMLMHHAYENRDKYHTIFRKPAVYPPVSTVSNCPFRSLNRDLLVNSAHHQCIALPGKELMIQHYAQDGTIETIYHSSLPIFGLQWHPERLFVQGQNQLTPLAFELLFCYNKSR